METLNQARVLHAIGGDYRLAGAVKVGLMLEDEFSLEVSIEPLLE